MVGFIAQCFRIGFSLSPTYVLCHWGLHPIADSGPPPFGITVCSRCTRVNESLKNATVVFRFGYYRLAKR